MHKTTSTASYRYLDIVPEKTTIVWTVEATSKEYRQDLDLQHLADGFSGTGVIFTLGPDNKWTVTYEGEKKADDVLPKDEATDQPPKKEAGNASP